MPSKIIAVVVSTAQRSVVDETLGSIKAALVERMDIADSKPKEAGQLPPSAIRRESLAAEPEGVESISPQEMADGYKELNQLYNELLDKLKERVGDHLEMVFSPMDRPELSEAIARFFRGVNNKITYRMYLAALEIERELGIMIGENESVTL